MLVSIAINYVFGLLANPASPRSKAAVTLAVIINLALLAWFKYAVFFCENLRNAGLDIGVPQIVLPIGISFFTFQGMSYVIDVRRGLVPPEKNPLRVALYISLFPQLIAGPIVRYSTVAGEIAKRNENLDDCAEGGVRFTIGLAKKVIIANTAGELADAVFSGSTGELTVSLAWLGALAYTAQIYFDFSGYSDMAIGLGRVFGFHFEENFRYPYISKSVTEFWRRWHISLSTWFRDYVYIPLGGNKYGKRRQIFNMMVVWALTGFWHGAAWNFLLWGLYYFLFLVCEKYVWNKALDKMSAPLRHVYTMLIVIFGWVLFRSETAGFAFSVIKSMLGGAPLSDGRTVFYLKEYGWAMILAAAASLPIKNLLNKYLEKHRDRLFGGFVHAWMPKFWALMLLAVCYVRLLSFTFNPFIYFRF
ncbi:MAG: MBOAT family O-acyltransferase [Oscillospiraceae bacterium]